MGFSSFDEKRLRHASQVLTPAMTTVWQSLLTLVNQGQARVDGISVMTDDTSNVGLEFGIYSAFSSPTTAIPIARATVPLSAGLGTVVLADVLPLLVPLAPGAILLELNEWLAVRATVTLTAGKSAWIHLYGGEF